MDDKTKPETNTSVSVPDNWIITEAKEDKIPIVHNLFRTQYPDIKPHIEIMAIEYPAKDTNPIKTIFLVNKIIQAYNNSEFIGKHKALTSAIGK